MQDPQADRLDRQQGCTPTMIEEIVAQLKKRKMIKVKWLQNTEVDPEAVAVQAKAASRCGGGRWCSRRRRDWATGTTGMAAAKTPEK